MMNALSSIAAAAGAAVIALTLSLNSASSTSPSQSIAMDEAALTAAPQEAMPKPGPEHKALAARKGTWDIKSTFRMTPEMPFTTSASIEEVTVIAGGFFIHSVQKGKMMGQPFEGHLTLGFNQMTKKYTGTWLDNFGSYITSMEGTMAKDGKTMTMWSEMPDPQTGKMFKVKMVSVDDSADQSTFRMYMPGADGEYWMNMEQVSTRRK